MMKKKRKKNKNLPVLLLADIENLGQRGEIVEVKPGYFRYLISQKKAYLATEDKLKGELRPLILSEKIKERQKNIEEIKNEIEKLILEYKLKRGPANQVFNPLTKEKIIRFLKEKGFDLSKAQVELKGKINNQGNFEVLLNLGYGIKATLKIRVI